MKIYGKPLASKALAKHGGLTTSPLYRYLIKQLQGHLGLWQIAGGGN